MWPECGRMHGSRAGVDSSRVLIRSSSSEFLRLMHAHVGVLEMLRQAFDVAVGHGPAWWLKVV